MADDEIVIGIRGEFDDFIKGLKNVTGQTKRESQAIQDSLNKGFEASKAKANLKSLAAEQKKTFQTIEGYSKRTSTQYQQNGIAVRDYRTTLGGISRDQNAFSQSAIQSSKAVGGMNENFKKTIADSPSLRYALYDISNSLRNIAIGAAALSVAPIGFSIKYERDFANVIRTNELAGDSIDTLRKDLLKIAQTTPISWADVTNIATLAGQLGIAEDLISGFTETVAQFAATTDLSVEASATAFGRLDQLISGVDGQFENLGSAILAVGVDSVATESQIVQVAQNIASMGNLAGLSASEIIGLSGALASLGIRPELARGTVTRLFSNIGKSAALGGKELEEFSRLTGRTADEFVSAWSSDPGAVLQDFFDGINSEGPRAERTLRELGITSVRDIPAILRLAQNSDEVRRLIALSADEYQSATKVSEQYGIISGTVAEQLNRLTQNFATFAATVGDTVNPLSFMLGALNAVVEGFTAFAQIPAGQIVFGFGVILAATTAALAAYGAVLVGALASVIAFRFAKRELGTSFDLVTPKILYSAAAMRAFIAAATGAGVASQGAAVKVGLLGRALSLAGPIGIALTAISAIGIAVSYFTSKAEDATEKADRLGVSMEALGHAIEADTAAVEDGDKAFSEYAISVQKTGDGLKSTTKDADAFLTSETKAASAIDDTTAALDEQTRALGENAVEFVRNQLIKDEDVRSLFSDPASQQAFIDAGGDVTQLLLSGLEGTSDEYINGLLTFYNNSIDQLVSRRKELNLSGDISTEEYAQIGKQIAFLKQQIETLNGPIRDNLQATNAQKEAYDEAAASGEFLGNTQEDMAKKTVLADDAINDVLDSMFGAVNYTDDVSESVSALGDAFRSTGEDAFNSSGAIQDVINTIANNAPDGDINLILGNLGALLVFLQAQGPAAAAGVKLVEDAIVSFGGQAGYAAGEALKLATANQALAGFDIAEAFNKITTSAGGAAKKVETLAEQFDKLVGSMFESINLGRDAEDAIFSLGEAFGETGDQALYASDEMQDAIGSILAQSSSAEEGVANLAALFSNLAGTVGGEAAPSLQILRQAISQVAAAFGITEAQAQQFIDTAGGGISNINFDNFNRGIQSAQEEVRTLLDYASDLEAVFSRAFDIRFSTTFAIDEIAAAWFDLGQNVEDARLEIEDLIAAQEGLSADRSLKEYFLSVAEAYGDTLRAGILREELAALNKEQEDNAKAIAEAQAIAGGDLTGQGPGQRQNRAALLGLVGDYQGYITALAESGASQDELRKATERARKEFIAQAIELGYQEDVVMQYAAAFDDVRTAIDRVPRDITVDANVNPALQALNELNASLNKQISAARSLNAELGKPIEVRQKVVVQDTVTLSKPLYLTRTDAQEMALFRNKAGFAEGGYTGGGGKYQPAGIVHRGEYVVPSQYVNQSSGLPNANFLAQLQNGMRGYAQGGFVGGGMGDGTMMVELSPYDRKLLADAGNVQLRVDGKVVASATNRSNFNEARRGSN